MKFLKNLLPDIYAEDVYSVNYHKLYELGIRGIIFDIDNTLVAHGAESNPKVEKLFKELHDLNFSTLLLSNNSRERVESFNRNINTLSISSASKPDRGCFLKALELLGTTREQTLMIGDTLFTDIRGANRVGIRTVLVKYMGYYLSEPKGKRRYLEKMIVKLGRLYGKKKTIL